MHHEKQQTFFDQSFVFYDSEYEDREVRILIKCLFRKLGWESYFTKGAEPT